MKELDNLERVGVTGILAILGVVMFLFLVPSSTWMTVNRMDVRDAASCKNLTVDYDRTFRRAFDGAYRIEVDNVTGGKVELVYATQWTPVRFNPERTLPDPVSLEWFVGPGVCDFITDGEYRVTAYWAINPGAWLFDRTIRRVDQFHVGALP